MSAISGIWNRAASAQADPLMNTKAAEDTSSGSGTNTSSGSDTTISANDFLTLLVTEMQNQDPTADTDPNEYINQLVNVNSLEQLININQTLTTAFTVPTSDSTPAAGSSAASAATAATSQAKAASATSAATPPTSGMGGIHIGGIHPVGHPIPVVGGQPVKLAQGNLSSTATRPSALRVARSLDGQHITR